jgi:hypothetical protein
MPAVSAAAPLRIAVPLAFAGLVLAGTAAPAAAQEARDQVVLSGALVVPRGSEVGEVVVLHGSARIDGVARGDVVVVDGGVVVHGQVSGSVIAIYGRAVLGPNAQVNGDVTAAGTVTLAEGSRVGGRVRQHVAFAWRTPVEAFGRFASWLAVSVSTLLLGLLVVLLAPRAADAVALAARSSPWPSAAWALALAVAVPAVGVLALASLVALPLGLVVLLALAPLVFLGHVLASYALGRGLLGSRWNRAVALLLGWLILRGLGVIPIAGGIAFGAASAYGLGAAGVATWRARATAGRHRGGRRAEVALGPPLGEEAGL